MTINVNVHNDSNKEVLELLNLIIKQNRIIMTKQEKLDASIARLNGATNEIAADLKSLRDEIKDTVSDESLATLDANVTALEAMGTDPANPVPEPVPPVE